MTRKQTFACATIAIAMALSGCERDNYMGGMELSRVRGMPATGSEFNKALFAEYVKLSGEEFDQGDYRNSDRYALRARSVAQGGSVGPEEMSARKFLPSDKMSELNTYRARLVAALNNGSKERMPRDAAHAQGQFDCWMEQQEENFQPGDIAECRDSFIAALAKIEVVVPVVAPTPAPPPKPENFVVYFDLDKATLNGQAQRDLERIVARAIAIRPTSIVVDGYADRTGTDAYNMALSERRATEIAGALRNAGINVPVEVRAYGDTHLAEMTPDDVPDPLNRRVVVTIVP